MSRVAILTVLLAGLIVVGSTGSVFGAQMDARINPNTETSPFKMNYQKTIFIEYQNGGQLFDVLRGQEWTVEGVADSSDPGVQDLMNQLNQKIKADGSQAQISDLTVSYDIHLKARNINTSVDYRVILEGTLSNYVITQDSQKTLIDLGWRGLTATGDIVVDGHELNYPINILLEMEPEAAAFFVGTEAESVMERNLIDANFILEQPLTNWHFLFDPTGINVDAGTFGLSDEIAGYVVSSWTMGESSIREGRQVERVFEAEVMADQLYVVRSVQSSDQGNLYAIGFGALDVFDGVEIAGVTPTPPEDYATTSTGDFPVMIIYGMAAIAGIAGGAFFMFSNRALKNEKTGQQGIDPTRLVGYQTSASSGGYQTNRGEAQLADGSDYQQTRSMYDDSSNSSPPPQTESPPPQAATTAAQEAACGCAASAEMGSECDCAMQGACLCDASCPCNADVCKEQVNSMS
ncbi:hypothetical protein [Nitrosopumilus sp.]|uniref:hypothetical protein n=1 Tax=Nitrosopumilus sp. TaxID=2024843 RepID=UPI003D121FEE